MKVEAFKCDVCGSLYSEDSLADQCKISCLKVKIDAEKKSKKGAELVHMLNYPRLNATSFPHFIELLEEYTFKIWKTKMTINVGDLQYYDVVSNYRFRPMGFRNTRLGQGVNNQPPYKGFTAKLTFNVIGDKSLLWWNEYFNGFKGINYSTGGNCTFFLGDFPLLEVTLNETIALKEKLKLSENDIKCQYEDAIRNDNKISSLKYFVESEHELYIRAKEKYNDAVDKLNSYSDDKYHIPRDEYIQALNKEYEDKCLELIGCKV